MFVLIVCVCLCMYLCVCCLMQILFFPVVHSQISLKANDLVGSVDKGNLNLREQNWGLLLCMISVKNETSSWGQKGKREQGWDREEKEIETIEFWLRATAEGTLLP